MLLVRYNTHDPFLPWFLRQVITPVFTVHHTLEGPELRSSHSVTGYVRSLADWTISAIILRQVKGILAVTSEIADYERIRAQTRLDWIFFPNGYYGEREALPDPDTTVHEVIFVSSRFAPWQGLDKLLGALSRSPTPIVVHIVGKLTAKQQEACAKEIRIKTHGLCTTDEIKSISARCSAGLSAFALEREGMKIGCTLKVRQYLATGLLVYVGHLDIFPNGFEFYHVGPCDIDKMVTFCDQMRGTSRQTIIERAWLFIFKTYILEQTYSELKRTLTNLPNSR